MANLIPVGMRKREALVRLGAIWSAVAVVVGVGLLLMASDGGSRVAKAESRLRSAKGSYEDLESQIRAYRRLVSQRDRLLRKQMAIETLRCDQRSISALRNLSDISGSAIWFERINLSEQLPKKAKRGASGGGFKAPSPSGSTVRTYMAKPVTVMITGFALSQQELAEFLGRVSTHERFSGVELRWSSRTAFLDGEAVKFVVSGAYR